MKGSGDAAHADCSIVDDAVDVLGGHARADFLSDSVQAGHVNLGALPDSVYRRTVFDQAPVGHDGPVQLIFPELFVKAHVAGFVFPAASAPARIVPFYLVLS